MGPVGDGLECLQSSNNTPTLFASLLVAVACPLSYSRRAPYRAKAFGRERISLPVLGLVLQRGGCKGRGQRRNGLFSRSPEDGITLCAAVRQWAHAHNLKARLGQPGGSPAGPMISTRVRHRAWGIAVGRSPLLVARQLPKPSGGCPGLTR